jgi:hypothetical protein
LDKSLHLDEKATVKVDSLAQRGHLQVNAHKRVFFNARSSTKIGTYNSRTLKAKWRRHELVCYCVREGIEILAIQEHRILFKSDDPIRKEHYGNDWVFLYTTADDKGGGGVGFLISSRVYKFISSVKSVSSRILQLNVRDHAKIASCFYSIYSPTSCSELDIVEEFYNVLSSSVSTIPMATILFIMGDTNAMLLKEGSVLFTPNDSSNRNTEMLVDFIQLHGLIAANTLFQKKSQVSFYGPKRRRVLLDYILVRKKWCKSVSNCDVKCVPSVASDHNLIMATIKWVLKNNKKGKSRCRYDLSYLKNQDCTKAVSDFINVEYGLKHSTDIQENYTLFSELTREAIEKFVPKQDKIIKRKPWEDVEITQARKVLEVAKIKFQNCRTPENKKVAASAAKTLSDLYISKENLYYIKLSNELMAMSGDNQHAEAWRQVNKISGRKARTQHVINADSEEERTKIWVSHFKNLLSPSVTPSLKKVVHAPVLPHLKLEYNIQLFTLDEIENATKSLQNGKASGVDEMINEILKLTALHPILLDIINQAYVAKKAPREWMISILVPVFKKGNSSDPNNYRGIALMCACAKLYDRLLLERLRSVIDKHLRYNQNGFRQLRSTAQHVLSVRRIFESIRMTQKARCVAIFVDFCKAFDSISWVQIEAILYAYQVPSELVQAIMSIYYGAKAGLMDSDGQLLDENTFSLSVGVLQGDTLAPYIFIIVMDFVMRSAMMSECGILLAKKTGSVRRGQPAKYLTDLDFADDIALFSPTIVKAQKLLNSLEKWAQTVGLKINQGKTEYILVGDWGDKKQRDIKVKAGPLKRVDDYKYLGSWLLNSKADFKIRKDLAWTAIKKMYRVWKSDHIDRKVKINLFLATIESILLYNATTWTMTKGLEKSLDGAYTKLLRYALNVSWQDHVKNVDLYGNLPKVSIRLRQRRLTFAAHCWRSAQSAYQPAHELLFWSVPDGVAKRGAYKTYVKVLLQDWYGESIKKREQSIAVLNIKSAMENRKEWKKLVEKKCK